MIMSKVKYWQLLNIFEVNNFPITYFGFRLHLDLLENNPFLVAQ